MYKRFSHTQQLTLNGAVDQVFPLFGAVRESEWAEGWQPTLIYSESPLADEAGAIFISSQPYMVWYVNHFEVGDHTIEYLRVTPELFFTVLQISCNALGENQTQASVTYTFTALSEEGNSQIDHLSQHHPQSVRAWQKAINHYLATGEVYSHA